MSYLKTIAHTVRNIEEFYKRTIEPLTNSTTRPTGKNKTWTNIIQTRRRFRFILVFGQLFMKRNIYIYILL